MSKLIEWLDHRMEVVGIENWKDLSEYSGCAGRRCCERYDDRGSLDAVESFRAAPVLAAALRVSLRKLEQLEGATLIGSRLRMS